MEYCAKTHEEKVAIVTELARAAARDLKRGVGANLIRAAYENTYGKAICRAVFDFLDMRGAI